MRGTSEWALKLSDLKCIMSQLVQLREALFVSVLRIETLEKSELLTFLELGITVADVFFTWIL